MPTHRRDAAARLHAGSDPDVLRAHRRRQAREPRRRRAARARGARGSERARAARDGRAAAAARGDRELSGGSDRGVRDRQQPGGCRRRAAAGCRSRACSTSSATTSSRIRRRSSSGSRRDAKCGCAAPTSSPAPASSRTPPARSIELRCTYDPATRGGDAADGRKVKATLHWVSAAHALDAEVRLYDRLVQERNARTRAGDYRADLNPASLEVSAGCKLEPSVAGAPRRHPLPVRAPRLLLRRSATRRPGALVFNRTVTLKDSWAASRLESVRGPRFAVRGFAGSRSPLVEATSRLDWHQTC